MDKKRYTELSVHELKNMTAAISGFSECISIELTDVDRTKVINDKVSIISRQMSEFLDKKYYYEMLSEQFYEVCNTRFRMSDVIAGVLQKLEEKYVVVSDIQMDFKKDFTLQSDSNLIHMLLEKLLENAVRYTSKGYIFLKVEKQTEDILFRIENDCEEIAQEILPHLTEPYFRADKGKSRELGGHGMGLAIVQEIIKTLDGRLDICYTDGMFVAEAAWKS
jgi:signal transduction histidine kinase